MSRSEQFHGKCTGHWRWSGLSGSSITRGVKREGAFGRYVVEEAGTGSCD
jgi:hypothetical protein